MDEISKQIQQLEKMLKKDGVNVENNTVVDFEKRFWNPAVALGL